MRYDKYGQTIINESELCDLYMQNPQRQTHADYLLDDKVTIDSDLELVNVPNIVEYDSSDEALSIEEFDRSQQQQWFMPDEYKNFDIINWVFDKCNSKLEHERVQLELEMFVHRDLLDLLRYLKYLVDVMREHNIVWGVGRGSCTCSYVLYLIGIHKIDSIRWNLDIKEFLREDNNV